MRISDWSSDVCSSDLQNGEADRLVRRHDRQLIGATEQFVSEAKRDVGHDQQRDHPVKGDRHRRIAASRLQHLGPPLPPTQAHRPPGSRSEEHTSELQSLMRISYAVFCLKKKKQIRHNHYVASKHTP